MSFKFDVKTFGLTELNQELLEIGDTKLLVACEDATRELIGILEKEIKANYRSMVSGDYADGVLENSISSALEVKHATQWVGGSAGVFKIDSVMSAHGEDPKSDISAPLKAYWLEFSVKGHSLAKGARAARLSTARSRPRRERGQDSGPWHPGFPPKPFITRAYAKNQQLLDRKYREHLNKVIKKAVK